MIRPLARRRPVRRPNREDGAGPPRESAAESAMRADLAEITPPSRAVPPVAAVIVSAAAGLAFALLTTWIAERGSALPAVDEHIHRWVISRRSQASITIARACTWGGVTKVVLPALIAVGAVTAGPGRDITRRLGSGLLLSLVASAGVFAEIRINALIGRARPPMADWAGAAGGPAFPSGHTTAATLFAGACAWALATRAPAGWPRRAVWAGAAVYAAAVGWSRVWLGVHWPADVVGGWLFGIAWLAGSIAAFSAVRRRRAGRRAARSAG
jgi:membrane-associated phospholipid phosphatase